jgi:cytochrome b involved in lipid metabolism
LSLEALDRATLGNENVPLIAGVVTGAAGTAHPFFHLMDEFTGRSKYNSRIGEEARTVRSTYPVHWLQFLDAVKEVSVGEYLAASKNLELQELWETLKTVYGGKDGLLGVHRRKVYGFLSVSFWIGRNSAINGLGWKRVAEKWQEANEELEKSRVERNFADHIKPVLPTKPCSTSFPISEIVKHNSEEMGYWFSAGGYVYNASAFMRKHPGGNIVIALCSGQDITADLKTVAHLSNPKIRSILQSYQIGKIQRPRFASVDPEDAYDATVELGEKSAEIENIYRTTFQFLNGKMTALDQPNVLTPQKARHLRESQCQLHDEHAPLLATLLDTVLAAVLRLDPQREHDLNPLRARRQHCFQDYPSTTAAGLFRQAVII